ncbi:hypothetical protein KZ843_22520, partial [Pseudomonas aeruginosa]|nr:hypothetical protein [Pseudomonas aeruginosa]
LAEAIAQADLDRDALCGAEFVIGHGATPYRNGRVLHSVFAAAKVLTLACRHVVFGRGASRVRDGSKKRKNYVA